MTTTPDLPDFRDMCAELLQTADILLENGESSAYSGERLVRTRHLEALDDCAERARAALATPPPEPPTDEELIRAAEESGFVYKDDGRLFNSYQDCTDIKTEVLSFARAVLERWGAK